MNGMVGMASMVLRENLFPGELQRIPEPLLMDAQDQVRAWHAQGGDEGPMMPIYHLNALACSRLLPGAGTVVDLACGTGRFSAYLARRRPDLKVVGFDLSPPMVDLGNSALGAAGLAPRVELRVGDMTAFSSAVPPETALVVCQFALHHLPTLREVEQCFVELAEVRRRTGCAFWLFDLARPRHRATAVAYPEVLTPDAPEVFKLDSTNSLLAAYSHSELADIARRVFGRAALQSALSRFFPLYQAFWGYAAAEETLGMRAELAAGVLSPTALRQYRALRAVMRGIPQ